MQRVEFNFEDTPIVFNVHDDPDHISKIVKGGKAFYEIDLLKAIRDQYNDASLIVDAGANIGNHTVFFSKILKADVIAFEPFEKNREILAANVRDNGCEDKVSIMPYALGEARGYGDAKVKNRKNFGTVEIQSVSTGPIEIVPLDEVLPVGRKIGIMKIDVEGFEVPLLKGAMKTLNAHKPHLFIEAQKPEDLEELKAVLEPAGYRTVARYCATPTYHFKYHR